MVASLAGPRRARRGLFVVCAKVVPDRVIRRRSICMICAGSPVSRRVLHNRGLIVVTVPADTDCTIRLETPAPGWRTANRGVEELTGRDIAACLAHSPGHRAVRAEARLGTR
jgi:hypothetical protein